MVTSIISVVFAVLSWLGIDGDVVGEKLGIVEPKPECGICVPDLEPEIEPEIEPDLEPEIEPEPKLESECATIEMYPDGTIESVTGGEVRAL